MQRFPTVGDLAAATMDEVLHYWTGLGYYARGRNLHKAANAIVNEHKGKFPTTQEALETPPGIGRSTAGAIRAIGLGQPATILDGNVKRVLTRFHAIEGYPGQTKISRLLWHQAEAHTPQTDTAIYTQAIMDLGATLCVRRNPRCEACPVSEQCQALAEGAQHNYPTPKPKKDKPVRGARFFIITTPNGAVLLEQQPMDGLWGGLWSPPHRSEDCSLDTLAAELGLDTAHLATSRTGEPFRHTFTHYHLDIEPVYATIDVEPAMVAEGNAAQWVQPKLLNASNSPIGLSAVAVKLLATLDA